MSRTKRSFEVVTRIALLVIFVVYSLVPTAALAMPSNADMGMVNNSKTTEFLPRQEAVYYAPPMTGQYQDTSPEGDEVPSRVPEKDPVEFIIATSKGEVGSNRTISIDVIIRNHSDSVIENLSYYDNLEDGFEFNSSSDPSVDHNFLTDTITREVKSIDAGEEFVFSYTLELTDSKSNKLSIHGAEIEYELNGETRAQTASLGFADNSNLVNGDALIIVPDKAGDGWQSADRYSLFLDEEVFSQNVVVAITPTNISENGPDLQFELKLIQTSAPDTTVGGELEEQDINLTQTLATKFDDPAYLQIGLDGYMDLSDLPAGREPYVVTYDESSNVWVKVPILETDPLENTITVEAAHFSTWGAGLGNSLPQNGANILLFDQPYTSLFTGSSRYSIPVWTPPGRAGVAPDISLSYSSGALDGVLGDVQASWVGSGWNIDGIEIVRKISTNENGYGYENSFALTLNGTVYELLVDPNQPNRYYTKQGSFLYIERHNAALANSGGVTNKTGEWWEVVTTDGTRYRLGWNIDSEQLALMYGYSCTNGNPCTTPGGAYATLGYAGKANDLVALRWRVDKITDAHGNYITYSYTETQPSGSSTLAPFDRESYISTISYTGFDNPQGSSGDLDPGYQVKFVTAARSTIGDVPTTFNIWDNLDSKFLDKIQICYLSCDVTDQVIRTYDFGYSLASVPNANGTLTLTGIEISGGGFTESGQVIPAINAPRIQFSYQNLDNRAVTGGNDKYIYPRLYTIDNGTGGKITYTYETDGRGTDSWYNYRVKEVLVQSSGNTAAYQAYTYTIPIYSGSGGNPNLGSLIGYTISSEKQLDYNNSNAVLLETRHTFGTVGLDMGYELITESLSGATVLNKSTNTYVTDNTKAPFTGWNYRYLYQTINYVRNAGSLIVASKAVYTRDPSNGNLLLQTDYLGTAAYRKTYYEYLTNPASSVYILDKPSRALVVTAANAILTDTRYHYDDRINAAPLQGDLTLTQSFTGSGNQTVDSGAAYDVYGNPISSAQYTSYGTVNVQPSGSTQVTSITYDTASQTFPVTQSNALNQSVSTAYLYRLAAPYQVTDANGWVTSTTYDGLGRKLAITVPGVGQEAVWYTYPTPNASGKIVAPYAVEMQILDTTANVYRSVWGLYDGLGRQIQMQVYDDDLDKVLVTDSYFNAQGLTWKQSAPYYVIASGGFYLTPNGSQFTETLYDALGRATQVTQPGNIITAMAYDGLSTTTTDPNGNKTERATDGLGRLAYVREYSNAGASLYSTTRYTNDALNRLTQVTDAYSNITTLQYDWLGRKTGMDDPDMGIWEYQYHASGSLYTQEDARGEVLTFTYDALNRLLTKSGTGVSTSYEYGTTQGMIGMRTEMSDAVGTTTWSYDNYGRSVTENREIGAQEKTLTTNTDWLGRPLTVVHPDNEVLTYTYDALGRPETLDSDQEGGLPLVDLTYNVIEQVEEQVLGNEITIENSYDGNNNRLLERTATIGANDLIDFAYTYDNAGNITKIIDASLSETHDYTYDFLNRLKTANAYTTGNPGNVKYSQQFAYDHVGNITQMNEWKTPSPTATATLTATSTPTATPTQLGFDPGSVAVIDEGPAFAPVAYHGPQSNIQSEYLFAPAFDPDTDTPTPTPTETPTPTQTYTPSNTATSTRTATPTKTLIPTNTPITATPTYWSGVDAYTVSILHMDGADASTTFIDETGKTWTANGNAQIDTAQSKFGGAAGFFDGTGDYIEIPDSEDFNVGSGDFTVDFWFKKNANGTNMATFGQGDSSATGTSIGVYGYMGLASNVISVRIYSGSTLYTLDGTTAITDTSWHHYAAARDGNTLRLFLDGTSQGTLNVTGVTANNSTNKFSIGRTGEYPGQYTNGWIEEFRFSKGIARWTSTFTPPTLPYGAGPTPTPTATYTPSHTPTVTPTNWSGVDSDTKSLLHGDGADASTTFTDETGKTWTAVGNAQIDTTQSKYGGASGLFDGTGDYISASDNNDWQLDGGSDSNPWTVDFWVRFNGDPGTGNQGLVQQYVDNNNSWAIHLTNNILRFRLRSGGVDLALIDQAWNPAANTWYHVAVIKNGTSGYMFFIDGAQIGATTTDTDTIPDYVGGARIGLYTGTAGATNYLNGWLDEVRISKGIARWTSTFTPPTLPYGGTPTPTATSTQTLTPTATPQLGNLMAYWSFDNVPGSTVPDDAPGDATANDATLTNGPEVETTGASGSSVFFDGTNDYASIADQAEIKNNGSFTISAWINPASIVTSRTQYIAQKGGSSKDYGLITVSTQGTATPTSNPYPNNSNANGSIAFQVGDLTPNTLFGPILPVNTWTLVTGVYDATANKMHLYLNGELVASQYVTGTVSMSTTGLTFSSSSTTNVYHGRLDEVRFYNRAITSDEVQTLFGTFATPTPLAVTATPTVITATPNITPLPLGQQAWGTGNDGDLTVSGGNTFNLNTQNSGSRTCADGGDAVAYNITSLADTVASLSGSPSTGCLAAGDEVLLIQLTDSSTTNYNAGSYEFLRVASVSSSTVTFATQKTKWYGNGWRSDANIGTGSGQYRVMLMRVPNYDDVTVDGTITANPFDGNKYGVLAFRVKGSLLGGSNGKITAKGLGFPGQTGYGAGGQGAWGYTGATTGTGGGGGYGTNGTNGTGSGGTTYGTSNLSVLFLGSGGGHEGLAGPGNEFTKPGAIGGGILYVLANTINFSGTISASGDSSTEYPFMAHSKGGAGSGGSVRIEGNNITLGSVAVPGGTAAVQGGYGRIAVYYQSSLSGLNSNPAAYTALLGQAATATPSATPITFATPSSFGNGRDGDLSVATGNTFNMSVNSSGVRTCADGASYSVVELTTSWARLSSSPSISCFAAGDEILVMHLNGSGANIGKYEFLHVGTVIGNIVYFTTPKTNYYGNNPTDDTGIGSTQIVSLSRVPNYDDVTVDGTITANPFDGNKYGVLAFRVKGSLLGGSNGKITAKGLGFPGQTGYGAGGQGTWGYTGGTTGTGGGGGYGTNGTNGTGSGGTAYGTSDLSVLFLGSGGGHEGLAGPGNEFRSAGAIGGGILYVLANTINFSGTISASGDSSTEYPSTGSSKGGAGSGGSVRIEGNNITLGSVAVPGGTAAVQGGYGRIAVYYQSSFSGTFTGYLRDVDDADTPTPTSLPTATATATPIANSFTANLAGWWSLNETSGTRNDSHSTNHLTDNNTVTYGTGKVGNAGDFELSNSEFLEIADNAALSTGDIDFMVSAWIKLESLPSTVGVDEIIVGKIDSATVGEWKIMADEPTNLAAFRVYNSAGAVGVVNATTFGALSTGTWYYITAWHDATANTVNIQVNNGAIDSAATTGVPSDTTANLRIGAQNTTEIAFFDGLIDEVAFYKRILTSTERTLLYNSGSGRSYSDLASIITPTPTATPQTAGTPQQNTYTYSGTIPHAVTSVSHTVGSTDTYTYDANGNMTCRVEKDITYKQTYNTENRISSIAKLESGTCASPGNYVTKWDFAYDGDGVRAATLTTPYISGAPQTAILTAYYFGGAYEVTGSDVRKYYSFGGQSILRDTNGLQYFLSDHLGSVVAITDDSGTLISEQRYLPFGGVRQLGGSFITQTDYGYTGQRNDSYIKLMDYDFRWYSPELARFVSPDDIVPNPSNPQSLNRYAYVRNNPIRYNDPTGHRPCGDGEAIDCDGFRNSLGGSTSGGGGRGGGTGGNGGAGSGGGDGTVDGVTSSLKKTSETTSDITCGLPGVYSSQCAGWHQYNVENVVCPAIFQCKEEEMIDYLSRFGYPNQDPSQPALPGRTYTVGIPIIGFDLGTLGKIVFSTSNSGLTTTNTTLSTHILYDGVVVRSGRQNANGDWVVVTQGYGNNTLPGMDIANTVGGPLLFNTVDAQMLIYIAIDQLFGS